MGAVKELVTYAQYGFLDYTMEKDGAPQEEINNTTWEGFVEAFYEGDEDAAWEDAKDWWGVENDAEFPL
jgi:hypothetical protein